MKKVLLNFIMFIVLVLPISVLAESNLKMECDENNVAGKELACTLKVTLDEDITANKITGNINFNDASVTFEWENGFAGSINNNILTITGTEKIESGTLGKINIKYPIQTTGQKNIGIFNIKLYNNEELVTTLDNTSESVKIKSDEKTLKTLLIEECEGCKLSPVFKSDLTIYNLTTTTDTIKITAEANGNATVSGTGLKKVSKDKQTLEIVVTSEAGNTKKYKINVKKVEPLSNDDSLKSLTIDSGTLKPDFSSDVTSYIATVDKAEVVISATANDSRAKVSGTGKKTLKYGKNDFNIVVTAEDGTAKNYLVVINRLDTRNANAYLKELTINGEKIGFEKDIIEYSYTVGVNVNSVEIIATPELETSKVTITGDKDLKTGENEVIITVQAEDESKKEYRIKITKEELERKEVFLQNLTIEGYNISFDPSTFDYTIVIKDENKLNIVTIPEDENYNVEILGNENLKNGSIIKIIVTSENNESNIYKIRVTVNNNADISNDVSTNETNYIPIIMTIFLVVLVILNIIEISKKYRKK